MSYLKILLVLLMVYFSPLNAQTTGQIYGTVKSDVNGDPLPGINVIVKDTKSGAASDIDGKFQIKNLPSGIYTLTVSGIGFLTKTITDVTVDKGQRVEINITLSDQSYNTSEITITANKLKSSEEFLLSERRKSAEITDQLSADQIKRTPDATSSDALKRVTGINIVDNKFVYIRGITDRYNETTLDGSTVSSTEMGKKSFSFDMLPSNLLEFTSVVKSSSPDLPGNFTGGLVQLNTLDFPSERIFKITYGSSYNSTSTFKNFNYSSGSSTDWAGFDNGSRSMPQISNDMNQIGSHNNWAPKNGRAVLNNSMSLVYANYLNIGENDFTTDQLGYVVALSYKNSNQKNDKIVNDEINSRYNTGATYESNVLWGALANLSLKLNGYHKISLKNNFNQSGIDNLSQFTSLDNNTNLENRFTVINWSQRSAYNGNINGEHSLASLGNAELKWRVGLSSSKREDPDRKEFTYYRELGNTEEPFTAAINQRSWSKLNDRAFNYGFDIVKPLADGKIKAGALYEKRVTGYNIRYFNIIPDYQGGISYDMTHLPMNEIYSPSNFGKGKFIVKESSKASDSYSGEQKLFSSYLMGDYPFSLLNQKFRITGGVRLENSLQDVSVPKTLEANGPVSLSSLKNIDYLPSFNFTYMISDYINFRAAYSHTVNRPDFRELASTGSYDFIRYELVGGNPDLKRALVKNLDLRLEVFPGIGELFAVSFFKKNISDAIEERLFQSAVRTRSWFNSEKSSNYGWEFEIRKSLAFIHPMLHYFSVMANYTRVQSSVTVKENSGNSSNTELVEFTRPLQGQSPYIMNYSLWYSNTESGTTINIMYNKFGKRLDAVGFMASDIYEEPRDMIDLSVSQQISSMIDLKLSVKNITGNERILTRDNKLFEKTRNGTVISLQAGLSF